VSSYGALDKINFFFALLTDMFFLKLVGKNFFFFTTTRAFTGKRTKVFDLFEPWAIFGCRHEIIPPITISMGKLGKLRQHLPSPQ
jgi:hypothetical protein